MIIKFLLSSLSFQIKTLVAGLCLFSFALISSSSMADEGPLVFGVTEGSVYKEFVKPQWYNSDATATLAVNSGEPQVFNNGDRITSNGNYVLTVSESGLETIINFEINNTSDSIINTNQDKPGTVLELNFQDKTYHATPLFAIWTEDIHGNFIQNLYVSSVPATNIMRFTGSFVKRPQALPVWMHKACMEKDYNGEILYLSQPEIPIPDDLDGVSGATQKAGFSLRTNAITNAINDSRIKVFFELNQSWDDGWYFYESNADHEEDGTGAFSSDPNYGASGEPAIVYSVEIDLNNARSHIMGGTDGETTVMPVGYGHYGGRTAVMYTDFYADDNGTQRYKFDHAHQMVELLTVTTTPGSDFLYLGDFNRDNDVDGADFSELALNPELIEPYLSEFAENFGTSS